MFSYAKMFEKSALATLLHFARVMLTHQPHVAFVQSKGCNENLITAIDSALSLAVIYYSQATAHVQLMTAEVPKLGCN